MRKFEHSEGSKWQTIAQILPLKELNAIFGALQSHRMFSFFQMFILVFCSDREQKTQPRMIQIIINASESHQPENSTDILNAAMNTEENPMKTKSSTVSILTSWCSGIIDGKTCDENSYEYTFQELLNLATIMLYFFSSLSYVRVSDERIFSTELTQNQPTSHKC